MAGPIDQPLFDHLGRKPEMAGIEDFHLRLHAKFLHALRHRAQDARRLQHYRVLVAEIHAAAIERADFGLQRLDMCEPRLRIDQVAAGGRLAFLVGDKIAAHAGGKIDDHVDAAAANALDDVAVETDVARTFTGFRIAHMAVHNRRAGFGGFDGRIGDLFRRDRNGRVPADRIAGAGNGAGQDDFTVHSTSSP
jgi:hypothetical protein